MEQMAQAKLPPSMGFEWTGMSYQEKQVGGEQFVIFALAVVFVFLVLAAQYESWTSPAAVIAVVPLAALGVVVALSIARNGQQHVHADRHRAAGGLGQQERDSDRRIRSRAAPQRKEHSGGGRQCGHASFPRDPDDRLFVDPRFLCLC